MAFFTDKKEGLQFSERKPLKEAEKEEKEEQDQQPASDGRLAVFQTKTSQQMRRIASEAAIEENMPWHWQPGVAYHCFSFGDVDSLTYLKIAIRQQPLDYVYLSTWCMANADIFLIREWLEKGLLKRIDFYVGEIFNARYSYEYGLLLELCKDYPECRVAIFRNHAKIMGGIGPKFAFVSESSANVNTNPRSEQTTVTIEEDLFWWYKDIFDGITTFDRTQQADQKERWRPWQAEHRN